MSDLISIDEAAEQGIERLRMPIWANPLDHIKIDSVGGSAGPWVRMFSPLNKEINGRDPVEMLIFTLDSKAKGYLPYSGPLPDSDEYKDAQTKFAEFYKKGDTP